MPAAKPAYCTLELGSEMAFSAGAATLVDMFAVIKPNFEM
jgi:hypothetical protein